MTEQHNLIPMTPGDTLRDAREQRGWSEEEAAVGLKCDVTVIQCMEIDEAAPGLAPIYQKGFLKRYAQLLELPEEQTAPWLQEKVMAPPQMKSIFPDSHAPRHTDRWLRATSYVMASLLVGTLAWQMTHEVVRLSQRGSGPVVPVPGVPGVNGQPASEVRPDAHVSASIAALETLRPAGGRTGAAGRNAWAALDQPTPLAAGEHSLQLTTSADSWVEIVDQRGTMVEQDLVRAGSQRQYRGFTPFNITLGRSSAVQLMMDGQAVDLTAFTTDDVTQMLLQAEPQTDPTGESVADQP